MDRFEGRIAVVTGGGTGMGHELCRQLAAEGCHVATCDVDGDALATTRARCDDESPQGTRVSTFVADVSDPIQLAAFRDATVEAHRTDHVNLLFNNAGIAGGGSFVLDDPAEWDRTFAVCWGGVYHGTRTFLPLLLASDEGHVVNTSSVNGFWASLGPSIPHTAYSAAKFAVKGFTEALVGDFRVNAPHLKASVVMPGHVGTSIVVNSGRAFGRDPETLTDEQLIEERDRLASQGFPVTEMSIDDFRQIMSMRGRAFRENAPMSAAEAATTILDGVRAGHWRILVGDDAAVLDRAVREAPEEVYEPDFFTRMQGAGVFAFAPGGR